MAAKRSYRDLIVWNRAIDLVPLIYDVLKGFPRTEEFALSGQMRRASVSIAANIAEGQARRSRKEFRQHLAIAKGSLAELHTLLVVATRLGYVQPAQLIDLEAHLAEIGRPLAGLIDRLDPLVRGRKLLRQPTTDNRQRSLADWLDYQQRVHPRSIELGLTRVSEVWRRMGAPAPAPVVITVGGTNGKGSTVAFLDAMLAADGKRVGCYTSPHLLRYNERVRVCGAEISDVRLIDAFERIEAARAEIPLTYFEFGTLAALWIFAHGRLDVAVLEVGLGGRLDAVNIIDADAAIVTTIDLDHQDWLGNDRNSIAREKAGIFRASRPAIIGTRDPPAGLLEEARRIGATLMRADVDFHAEPTADSWRWSSGDTFVDLPLPNLAASCQIDNAAAAIAALNSLRGRIGWNPAALAAGVRDARIDARLQRFASADGAEVIVDVAHNPQAAGVLAHWLGQNRTAGRTFAVFGALDDKDVAGIVAPLRAHIDRWFLAGLDGLTPRGLKTADLRDRVRAVAADLHESAHADPASALAAARAQAAPTDRVIAFGSFYVAAEALAAMNAKA